MTKQELIEQLQLEPHIEGGYFRRSYAAAAEFDGRALMSSIFYLLTDDSPVGHLHRNRSDILHYWQAGGPIRYTLLSAEGELKEVVMGPDLAAGQQLQLLVPGGLWKASELIGGEFGLVSEAVCPGFDYRDMALADAAEIKASYPQHWSRLARLCQ